MIHVTSSHCNSGDTWSSSMCALYDIVMGKCSTEDLGGSGPLYPSNAVIVTGTSPAGATIAKHGDLSTLDSSTEISL